MLMIQCDFDDTITDGNVSEIIREAFAPPGWNAMEDEYLEGKLSVEESNIAQFALITADRREIEEYVLGAVVVRFAFDEFRRLLPGRGDQAGCRQQRTRSLHPAGHGPAGAERPRGTLGES